MSGTSRPVKIELQPIWPLAAGAINFIRKHEDLETPKKIVILFSFGVQMKQVINFLQSML